MPGAKYCRKNPNADSSQRHHHLDRSKTFEGVAVVLIHAPLNIQPKHALMLTYLHIGFFGFQKWMSRHQPCEYFLITPQVLMNVVPVGKAHRRTTLPIPRAVD